MPLSIPSVRIALAEGRQLEELAEMLIKEGAEPIRCPMLSILDTPDEPAVRQWLQSLYAGQFEMVVFFTGEGVRRLKGFAERGGTLESYRESLSKTPILTRGPKPMMALREMGLIPWRIADAPTTEGVISTLRKESISGKKIGVQLFAPEQALFLEFLRESGAEVSTVLPYVYAPAADTDRVADLIDRIVRSEVDAIVFTSSPQIERLLDVAKERNGVDSLIAALQKICVASVGPIVSRTLEEHHIPITVQPEQGFVMKNLVQHIKRHFAK